MSGNSTKQARFIKFVINGNQTFVVPTKEAVEEALKEAVEGVLVKLVKLRTRRSRSIHQ